MASMNEKDYYAVLEVDEKATTDEIRRAFQKKARKLHPDVNKEPDAEERFKEVSEAYAVLSDSEKRQRYDAMRSGAAFTGGYAGTPGGYGFGGSSPFEGFPFGGSWESRRTTSRAYKPHDGADINFELELDMETATDGTKRGVTYQRYVKCDVCDGSGSADHAHPITCPTCGGAGRMRIDLGGIGIFGMGFFEIPCPECEGAGKVISEPCVSCGGTGRVMSASEIVIDIPAESHDGDEVRMAGMGNAGTNGRDSGDFVCNVSVLEERLDSSQASGFRLAGMGLPVLAIGLVYWLVLHAASFGTFTAIAGAVMCGMGIATMARGGGIRSNLRWWQQAGKALWNGIVAGLVMEVVLILVVSSGLGFLAIMLLGILFLPLLMSRRR